MFEGFTHRHVVKGRVSIADLFPKSRRCGVYVLHFGNGEVYVGKAIDVTRRYVQHCSVFEDVEAIEFRRTGKRVLDQEERTEINRLEAAGHRLRNIMFTSLPKGESDFDLVMTTEEQDAWLGNPSIVDLSGPRIDDAELRRKLAKRYTRFSSLPEAVDALELLRQYVRVAIPAPVRSEVSFWVCSCLPAGPTLHDERLLARINLNWQVVLTLSNLGGELDASFHLARTPLLQAFGQTMAPLTELFPSIDETDNLLGPGGHDQMHLHITGKSEIEGFLREDAVARAMRLFNLRLMKKGPSVYGRYHCLELADRILSPEPTTT